MRLCYELETWCMLRTSPVSLLGLLNSFPSQSRSRVDQMHQKHRQGSSTYTLPHAQKVRVHY